jgi:AcrR family transcriptional regulator
MSKLFLSTEERIVSRALELFNERGIEYVGLRELATDLGMRVSNITYYFPTKDDLVFRLSGDLTKLNSQTIFENKNHTIDTYFKSLDRMLTNQMQYRCLFLSFVHLMENNKRMMARYRKTEKNRYGAHRANLIVLAQSGYLLIKEEKVFDFLTSSLAIILRFWISEARVSFKHLTGEQQKNHYLSLVANLLLPYATKKGKRQLQGLLKNL